MLRGFREQVKVLPVVGPYLHDLYLRGFKNEGEKLRVKDGPLSGRVWVRFMHTHNDEYVAGSYEKPIQEALAKHLRPGMVFYDVGANGGFFTLLGAELVGPSGAVVAFEPHPQTARCCREQIAANSFKNATVVMAAVSDKIGVHQFSDYGASVMASLTDDIDSKTITVATTTLDHELSRHPAPDVLKIDIEGSEIDALRGAAALISKKKPVLLVEVHSQELATQYDELMSQYGYQTFSLKGEMISVARSGERFVVSTVSR